MPSSELHDLTLAEAACLISVRKLSPVEYTESLLARTEALEPQLNAFITGTPDVALAAARTAEAEIMRAAICAGRCTAFRSPSRTSTIRPAS